eukprot:111758-Chlamydomonas_euryale.AAC.12
MLYEGACTWCIFGEKQQQVCRGGLIRKTTVSDHCSEIPLLEKSSSYCSETCVWGGAFPQWSGDWNAFSSTLQGKQAICLGSAPHFERARAKQIILLVQSTGRRGSVSASLSIGTGGVGLERGVGEDIVARACMGACAMAMWQQ